MICDVVLCITLHNAHSTPCRLTTSQPGKKKKQLSYSLKNTATLSFMLSFHHKATFENLAFWGVSVLLNTLHSADL